MLGQGMPRTTSSFFPDCVLLGHYCFSDFSISSCFHPHLGLQWGFLSFFCGLLKGCLYSEKAQISSWILILLLAGGRTLACESQWMLTLPCQPSGKLSIVSFSKDSQAMHFCPLDLILLHPCWSVQGPKLAVCPRCWVQKWRHCANTTHVVVAEKFLCIFDLSCSWVLRNSLS